MRTTVHQNLLLRWVRDETVYEVWEALRELGLGDAGADQVGDVVSCPGTDRCKLGITSSMGLNAAVRERLDAMQITDPLTRSIHIKMSGCPNGCSQHHIANIGFYGASIKVGEHTIPAYVAHIAGNYEGGEIVYGQRLKVRLPAKRVPEAVERWIRMYEAERTEGEAFNAFAARVGHRPLRGRGPRPRAAGRVRPRHDGARSSTGTATCRSWSSGARASARSERPAHRRRSGGRRARAARLPVLLPEGGVGDPRRAAGAGAAHARRDDRHRRKGRKQAQPVKTGSDARLSISTHSSQCILRVSKLPSEVCVALPPLGVCPAFQRLRGFGLIGEDLNLLLTF